MTGAKVVVLTAAPAVGKSVLASALKTGHGFAHVAVWGLCQMHLTAWAGTREDYALGCSMARAITGIYATCGKRVVVEEFSDRDAIALVAWAHSMGHSAQLVSLVGDGTLMRERLAARGAPADEMLWQAEIDREIERRPLEPWERRFKAREWIGRAGELAGIIAE